MSLNCPYFQLQIITGFWPLLILRPCTERRRLQLGWYTRKVQVTHLISVLTADTSNDVTTTTTPRRQNILIK